MTLPLLSFLSLIGAGAGVYLGKAAVGEIDPVYFSTPERGSRWHADLSPYRSSVSAPPLSSAAGAVYASGSCVGCLAYPEEYYPIHDAAVDRYEDEPDVETAEGEVQLAVGASSEAESLPIDRTDDDVALIDRYAGQHPVGPSSSGADAPVEEVRVAAAAYVEQPALAEPSTD